MSNMYDDDEEVDYSREDRLHQRTLNQYKDLDIRVREQKMEAMERMLRKTARDALKDKATKQSVSKDFLEKFQGKQKPDADLISFLRGSAGGSLGGVNNQNYEGDPTGFESMPWDEDEDY